MSSASSPSTKGGKTKKSYANCPAIQLIVRDNKGWRLYKQHHKTGKLQIQSQTKPCTDADIIFSCDGLYFAVLLEEGIEIYESQNGRKLHFLKHYRVRNVYFSPKNSFIVSYHHRRQDDKHGNCWVWKWNPSQQSQSEQKDNNNNNNNNSDDASNNDKENDNNNDIKVVYQFFLPEFNKKRVPLQFSDDEFIAARITRNAVLIHDVKRLHYKSNNIIGKQDIANVASVVVAPCKKFIKKDGDKDDNTQKTPQNSYIIAVFAMPKNNKAATVTIYEYQYSLAMNKKSSTTKLFTKISQRAFYGVDQCELLWDPTNSYHHNLLAIASSDVDTSGKSYYGNQTLFLLSSRNNITVKIPISEKGKLQDVKWHPYGKEFVMIDDHPQKITIFDYKGNEVKNLGKYARNLIRFSKDGRFLWCGGFGNLTGEMTFYDYKLIRDDKKQCLGYNTDDACRYFEWSPDSSTFLTARLYPYMTVDNGFRIYKYNGCLLYEEKFDRLYQISYRPSLKGVYPQRSPSPNARGKAKSIPKPQAKKRYVPPHLRSAMSGNANANKNNNNRNNNNKKKQQKKQQQPSQQRQQQRQPQQQLSAQQQQQLYHQQSQQYQQQQQQQQQQYQQQQYQQQQYQQPQQYQQQGQYNNYNNNNNQYNNNNQLYNNNNNNNNNNFQSGVYQHGDNQGDYLQPQQTQNNNQQIYQNQQQFQQMNLQQNNNNNNNYNQQNQQNQQQQNNGNNNNNNDGDGGNNKKKKRRKRNKNKNKQGQNQQNQQNNQGGNNNGGFKPGLAENDNKRWARGSKYTE